MVQESRSSLQELIDSVRMQILSESGNPDSEDVMKMVENTVLGSRQDLSLAEAKELIWKIYARTRSKLGVLERYIKDDSVNEIMINGKDNLFLETRCGMIRENSLLESTEELEEIIRNIAAGVHREINEMNPILDARLKDGSRVNAVCRNVAVGGPVLTIRKFAKERITISEMVSENTLTAECREYLEILVKCGYNIFISGGTSSGKTTFLNALSDFIPKGERVIVIEDSTELQLSLIDNLVQMECHSANTLGQGRITMEMLIRTSLRMRPDRIIVGEVRGREVSDMLQAMNTGHDGSMSTGHGNSVTGMLRRLEAMYLSGSQIPIDAIRSQIVEGIDIMVHLGRLKDGGRKVLEIQELVDFSNGKYILNPLFLMKDNGRLEFTGNRLKNTSKLRLRGESL